MTTPLEGAAGIVNACEPINNVITGGQPTATQLRALSEAGVKLVLDIRDPMEPRPLTDEPAEVRSHGMEYVNVPVSSATLNDDTMDRILDVLRQHSGEPIFFHCGSANRVGGALIAHFMLDQGMSEEQAMREGMRVGLRSPEYLQWGVDYARRHAATKS